MANTGVTAALGLAYWVLAARLYPAAAVGRGLGRGVGPAVRGRRVAAEPPGRPDPLSSRRRPTARPRSSPAPTPATATAGLAWAASRWPPPAGGRPPTARCATARGSAWPSWAPSSPGRGSCCRTARSPHSGRRRGCRSRTASSGWASSSSLSPWPAGPAAPSSRRGPSRRPPAWSRSTSCCSAPSSPGARSARTAPRRLLTPRALARFVGGDYVGSIFTQALLTLMPLLVVGHARVHRRAPLLRPVGGGDHASICCPATWPRRSSSSLSLAEHRLADYARTVLRRVALLVVPLALATVVLAPLLLAPFGKGYVDRERDRAAPPRRGHDVPGRVHAVHRRLPGPAPGGPPRRRPGRAGRARPRYGRAPRARRSALAGAGVASLAGQAAVAAVVLPRLRRRRPARCRHDGHQPTSARPRDERRPSAIHPAGAAVGGRRLLWLLSRCRGSTSPGSTTSAWSPPCRRPSSSPSPCSPSASSLRSTRPEPAHVVLWAHVVAAGRASCTGSRLRSSRCPGSPHRGSTPASPTTSPTNTSPFPCSTPGSAGPASSAWPPWCSGSPDSTPPCGSSVGRPCCSTSSSCCRWP